MLMRTNTPTVVACDRTWADVYVESLTPLDLIVDDREQDCVLRGSWFVRVDIPDADELTRGVGDNPERQVHRAAALVQLGKDRAPRQGSGLYDTLNPRK